MTEFDRGQFGRAIEKFDRSSDFPSIEERRKAWEGRGVHPHKEDVTLLSGISDIVKPVFAVGAIVAVSMLAGSKIKERVLPQSDAQRASVERCVGELIGREVSIPRDALGELQRPASVFDEQRACEKNGNNPEVARKNIRHIPLGGN